MEKKTEASLHLGMNEISIGVSVAVVLFACMIAGKLGFSIQALAACTGAVMCTLETDKASWKAGMTRILGVLSGGLVGVALVALDNAIQIPAIFYLLCGAGVAVNFLLCGLLKIPFIQAKVSCMTLLLVALVAGGAGRYNYALGRLIGTVCGAVVAVLVSKLFMLLRKDKTEQ